MDLGATVCTRSSPSCGQCPLASDCTAYAQGNQTQYPGKKPRKILPVRNTCFLLIHNQQNELLLQQNPPTGLWGGLWVLPQVESEVDIAASCAALGLDIVDQQPQEMRRHTFSHFHLDYQPIVVNTVDRARIVADTDNQVWYNPENPLSLGMPAPVLALLHP